VANGQSGGANRTTAITTDITFNPWRPSISNLQHQRSGRTNLAGYQADKSREWASNLTALPEGTALPAPTPRFAHGIGACGGA
jgi:hypothetical protein